MLYMGEILLCFFLVLFCFFYILLILTSINMISATKSIYCKACSGEKCEYYIFKNLNFKISSICLDKRMV